MNQVYLSGRIGPIVIQSKENEILHVTSVLTVMHTTASGIRKEEQFPISAWRGTGKQLLQQARKGSHIMIQGYLSWKQAAEKERKMEITVKEFQVSSKRPEVKEGNTALSTDAGFPEIMGQNQESIDKVSFENCDQD